MANIPSTQKFHTVEASVDTVDYGSSQLSGGREVFTMQDIIDTVGGGGGALPYKLYTAFFSKGLSSFSVTELSNDTGYTFDWEVSGSSLTITSSGIVEDANAGIYATYSLPTDGPLSYNSTQSIKQAFIQTSSIGISAVTLNMSTGVYNQSNTYSGVFELRVYGI